MTLIEPSSSTSPLAGLAANHRRFLAFLERRVESREAAEDILQEAYVRGLESSSPVSDEAATAWFYRVLRNAVVDHYRRRGSESRALEKVAAEAKEAVGPDESLMETVCSCVEHLLPALKPEYASAIRRVELDELSLREYAAEENMSANAAGVRLFRARQTLRKRLLESCGACAEHGCSDCSCGASKRNC
jgi:RNA polymerase sigma factor (sigma-70 family)